SREARRPHAGPPRAGRRGRRAPGHRPAVDAPARAPAAAPVHRSGAVEVPRRLDGGQDRPRSPHPGGPHAPAGLSRLQPEVSEMSDYILSRRRFLEMTGGALALYASSPLWLRLGNTAGAEPAPANGRKLLVVLLEGGND